MRILHLSRNYPNGVLPLLGLWVEGLVRHCAEYHECKVISPVPYCPPWHALGEQYTRFRRVDRQCGLNGIEVFHPRFAIPPGSRFHSLEALSYFAAAAPATRDLRSRFPFDLIHAHFTYPDGVVAARLGRRYGVPVVVTEHAPWRPNWMDRSALVRRQAVWAARRCAKLIAVSRSVRDTIVYFTGEPERVTVIPNGVDAETFCPGDIADRKRRQIAYVGVLNFNKGLDLLFEAMRMVLRKVPDAKLVLVGGSFYRNTRLQSERLRQMAADLAGHVEFAGMKPPSEVARYLRESALLVLPSRAESFGAVLIEALACGTPVVSTRCGGPEDIVDEQVGRLVPVENSTALGEALCELLENPQRYEPHRLRAYALERFGWRAVARRVAELYEEVLSRRPEAVSAAARRAIAS